MVLGLHAGISILTFLLHFYICKWSFSISTFLEMCQDNLSFSLPHKKVYHYQCIFKNVHISLKKFLYGFYCFSCMCNFFLHIMSVESVQIDVFLVCFRLIFIIFNDFHCSITNILEVSER